MDLKLQARKSRVAPSRGGHGPVAPRWRIGGPEVADRRLKIFLRPVFRTSLPSDSPLGERDKYLFVPHFVFARNTRSPLCLKLFWTWVPQTPTLHSVFAPFGGAGNVDFIKVPGGFAPTPCLHNVLHSSEPPGFGRSDKIFRSPARGLKSFIKPL